MVAHARRLGAARRVAGSTTTRSNAQRQPRQRRAVRQRAAGRAARTRPPGRRARLRWSTVSSGRPKSRSAAPADLDDHERRRRARVDRHEVELVAADMDVPGQDRPAGRREARGDQRLGRVAGLLGRASAAGRRGSRSAMPAIIAASAHPAVTGALRGGHLERREVAAASSAASSAMTGTSSRSSSVVRLGRRRRARRAGRARAGRRRASAGARGRSAGGTA